MIKVTDLVKRYGDLEAVRGISFEVNEGEIVGFLGPNGAGKTTTIRVLTGFTPASSGNAEIAGFDIFDNPLEVKSRIGYMPEFPPVYPDLTVADYLDFVADIKNVSKTDKKENIEYVVQQCGLEEVFNKRIGFLSKGYKQRTGIAQALIHKPEILFLDEPTSGLDPIQIIEVRNLIRELRKDHTIMLSTHILPEVSAVCDRVIIINKGRIVAKDTPENLASGLSGNVDVDLMVQSDPEKARSVVARLDYVTSVKIRDGIVCFQVKERNVIPDVARALVKEKIDIEGLVPRTASLEEVFLHLTTREEVVE
ncbi:MAG: ABC transporter ATP-binding protein [Candidatus Muiribacteriaceae bacterium]